MAEGFHIQCLKREFQRIHRRNPNYTSSAFARDVGLSRGSLSEILAGKRNISYRTCQKIFFCFNWPQDKRKEFIYHAAKAAVTSGTQRVHPEFKRILTDRERPLFDAQKIQQETFVIVSEWYHMAILEITFTDNITFKDSEKIAARLGLKPEIVEDALTRLITLGFLIEKEGFLKKSHKSLTLANPTVTSEALIKHQEQILEKAIEKLKTSHIEQRNNTGMVMAIDPRNIPKVKKEIRLFMHRICELLENGNQKEVYQLNVNLFSLEEKTI